jgi:hypothetical protein
MGKFINNPPEATSIMEASRSFGNYDLPSALADLIDNSITANCDTIEITCKWNDGNPSIRIKDDGDGMSEWELIQAMKPASKSPLNDRDPNDMGRFGLGLKTASFSQARSLTVLTRKKDIVGAKWDLDDINDWEMYLFEEKEIEAISPEFFGEIESGTEVIWEKTDRLTEEGSMVEKNFLECVISAKEELSKTFHRFINPPKRIRGIKKIKIILNGSELDSIDPFISDKDSSQELPEKILMGKNGNVKVLPYILPHYDKLTDEEHKQLGGKDGYIKNQGFYVYRNNRLILYGTWFKLFPFGSLSKLARISIDIPNSLDLEWKITVDKSEVQIPSKWKSELKELVKNQIISKSDRVFRGKSNALDTDGIQPVWIKSKARGKFKYMINTDHIVIKEFKEKLKDEQTIYFKDVLNLIADCFPSNSFFNDFSSKPEEILIMDDDEKRIRRLVDRLLDTSIGLLDAVKFQERLKMTEPFSSNMEIVKDVLEKRK